MGISVDVILGEGLGVIPGAMDDCTTAVEDARVCFAIANPPSAREFANAPITMSMKNGANNPPEISLERGCIPSHLPGR